MSENSVGEFNPESNGRLTTYKDGLLEPEHDNIVDSLRWVRDHTKSTSMMVMVGFNGLAEAAFSEGMELKEFALMVLEHVKELATPGSVH